MANFPLKKYLAICLAATLGSGLWIAQAVLADTGSGHLITSDSVDSGEIRYGGSTKYASNRAHGVAQWNTLDTIYIAPDTSTTIQDLTFDDVYTSETFVARYIPSSDTIQFNDYYMSGRSDAYNNKTATHEIGHALGIADHGSGYSDIIMYENSSTVQYLRFHDKDDYWSRW